MKKVGILGSGPVAMALGKGFIKHGYEAMLGSRDIKKLDQWKSEAGAHARTGSFDEAVKYGDLIVLAVKGTVAEELIKRHASGLAGKIVIDTTNPIAEVPPENGVLKFFTTLDNSLMERLQKAAPEAKFVKAFSCVGNALMVDPDGKPTMFICGNDEAAKRDVSEILYQFHWDVEDMGKVEAARAIEPLCILWCIPGFLRNEWKHAFKLLKA
ncbi:MAG TPA: NAD(P)-binding domain-containing protein [Cyclobacteriaceae bacterium]|nr:NAD(P)-binding domain-containing protein [Cyclobacteriaceae bacterium]